MAFHEAIVSFGLADAVWLPEGRKSFLGEARCWRLGDLIVARIEADPHGLRWNAAHPGSGYIGFSVNTRQFHERVVLGDRSQWFQTTTLSVWDPALLVEAEILSPIEQTLLLVPKAALHIRDQSHWTLNEREIASLLERSSARLLRDLLLSVTAEADRMGPLEARVARNSLVDLMVSMTQLHPPAPAKAANERLRQSISAWIDEQLSLGPISPSQAAAQHALSVRSLHRLFADSGETFGSIVRQRRLHRAWNDLVSTDDKIQTIAVRWGYSDASHFICDFKRAYGMTPLNYRQASRAAG